LISASFSINKDGFKCCERRFRNAYTERMDKPTNQST
jgi:hypothetical protein